MKTHATRKNDIEAKWHHVDASGKVLGKLAAEIAGLLMGKDKVNYVPYLNCGDKVVVTNSKKIVLTGNKMEKKVYYSHSRVVGNLRKKTAEQILKTNPNKLIYNAVSGMLPKNRLRKRRLANLYAYEGDEHPHKVRLSSRKDAKGK